jgi:hypothetical protein
MVGYRKQLDACTTHLFHEILRRPAAIRGRGVQVQVSS